jgi:hypothetical protein
METTPTIPRSKPRWKLFLEALPKHDYKIAPSAMEAGYSESYAYKCGNLIMTSALRAQAKETLRVHNTTSAPMSTEEAKATLATFIGMNSEDVAKTLKKIATQDKDYGSALKVLAPVLKEMGHNISVDDASKVSVPILNVIVDKPALEPHNGDSVVIDVPVDA